MPITRVVVNYPIPYAGCQLPSVGSSDPVLLTRRRRSFLDNLSTYSCSISTLGRGWIKVAPLLVDRKPQVFFSRSREPFADGACCSEKVSKEFVVKSRRRLPTTVPFYISKATHESPQNG